MVTKIQSFDATEIERAREILNRLGQTFDWFEACEAAEASGVSRRCLKAVLEQRGGTITFKSGR